MISGLMVLARLRLVMRPSLIASLLMSSVPTITVSELVIEEPASNPVGTIFSRKGKLPIVARILIPTLSNLAHGIILRTLSNVAPIVWGFALAVTLEVAFVRG